MKKLVLTLVLLGLSLLLAAQTPQLNKAQDFTLKNELNKDISLKDLLAKGPVILDFWASWCVPCKQSLPHLSDMADKYGDSLTCVAINVDQAKNQGRAKSYISSDKFKFIKLFDDGQEVMKKFNISGIPYSMLIAPDYSIVFTMDEYRPGLEEVLKAAVDEYFAGKKGGSGE